MGPGVRRIPDLVKDTCAPPSRDAIRLSLAARALRVPLLLTRAYCEALPPCAPVCAGPRSVAKQIPELIHELVLVA